METEYEIIKLEYFLCVVLKLGRFYSSSSCIHGMLSISCLTIYLWNGFIISSDGWAVFCVK